jgi:drug/metabolite transporter (DMT)-like permease
MAVYAGVLLTAVGQMFLKYGAIRKQNKSRYAKFYNLFTIIGYGSFISVAFLNLFALQKIELIELVFIIPMSYVLVLFGSVFLFHENLNKKQLVGFIILISGIIIFNL